MGNTYKYYLKHIFLLLLFTFSSINIFANTLDIASSDIDTISLLEHSAVYITDENETLQEIIAVEKFRHFHETSVNLGVSKKTLWIHFTLQNNSKVTLRKVLVPSSPLLESIELYRENDISQKTSRGMKHTPKYHNTIPYYFNINISPYHSKSYYLKIHSIYAPVNFTLTLEDKVSFLNHNKTEQAINILLVGVVLSLMVYAFLLSFYIKDKSYFYYGLYLFALIYQQVTYLGLSQIYLPQIFISLDMSIVLIKLVFLISSSALFAIHFLDTRKLPTIDKIYKGFIFLTLFEVILLDPVEKYSLTIVIITGALFITFNMIAGVFSYLKGHTQARLFILGFSIVFITYIVIISDALGLTSIMLYFNSALIWSTAIEAFILSLAFADRFILIKDQKENNDQIILKETKHRASIIQQEVEEKTKALNVALETKELLIKEVHHRVKNNLQIILSIIRLQNDEIDDPNITDKLLHLEHRINAISKTYTMLLITDDLGNVNMKKYIDSLLNDIAETYDTGDSNIDIKTDVKAIIPLKESVYLGLIINELVVNAYKYAFNKNDGIISVTLKKIGDNYTLIIQDNGKGFVISKTNSLGLKLIHTLIYNQLEGTMDIDTYEHTQYIIRFKI